MQALFIISVLYLLNIIVAVMMTGIIENAKHCTLKFNTKMLYSNAVTDKMLHESITNAFEYDKNNQDHQVLCSLLWISVNGLDQCHEIVQQMRSNHDATYIHSLLHRLEGENIGELGLKGWSNADYWNDQLGNHPFFPSVLNYSIELNQANNKYQNNVRLNKFVNSLSTTGQWDPSLLINLCIQSFRDYDEKSIEYCEAITTYEYRLLLMKYLDKL